MPVLDRPALDASPLADLHTIASELSIDGYRRLRREALIDAILNRQSPDGQAPAEPAEEPESDASPASIEAPTGKAGSGKAGSGKAGSGKAESVEPGSGKAESDNAEPESESERDDGEPARRRRPRRRRTAADDRDQAPEAQREPAPEAPAETPQAEEAEETVEGVVELLPNGSGFVRVEPPEPSDHDVYISAAQVKRCELVSGDRIAGPRRAPRRSERFASLVRIDTINGRPAEEVADNARFDDLPAAFPSERLRLGSEDPTIKAIEWLTPFGRGSRVTIVGPSRAGKTEALRRLTAALMGQELQISLALTGVRPEEISEWSAGPLPPAVAVSFAYSADAQASAVELVVDQARRVAARGAHAIVLIDTLDGLHPLAARKALAAARNLLGGGSLTVIATSSAPIGGETTVIALDRGLTSSGRFPAIDMVESGTIRPELLVGDAAAETISQARAEAIDAQRSE